MRIYLIRHGETDWNKQLRLQGREDTPLNADGILQAKECGKAIRKLNIDKIISSPLERARHTAKIIGEQMGLLDIIVEKDLIERDFGEASGMTYEEKIAKYDNATIPGLEPREHMLERMKRVINKYDNQYPKGNILMVSHGGSIRTILVDVAKNKQSVLNSRLKNAAVNVIEVTDQQMELIDFNMDAKEFANKYLSERN